jgi:hypothetical protein
VENEKITTNKKKKKKKKKIEPTLEKLGIGKMNDMAHQKNSVRQRRLLK